MAIVRRQSAEPTILEQLDDARRSIGGNNPPPDEQARDEFNDKLDAALRKRGLSRARFEELIGQAQRAQAVDDETVGRCGELVKSLRAATKLIEDIHTETKAPYLAAGREVDGLKNALVAPLLAAKKKVEDAQGVYLREQEQKRLAEERRQRAIEEEARRQREEAARANQAPMPEPEPIAAPAEPEREIIRGDFGAAVSGQKVWASHVEDYTVAFIAVADNEKVREAIDKAVAGMVRAGSRSIDGVRIYQTLKASNR